jgi:hypothetical protein
MIQGFQRVRRIYRWMGIYMKTRWTPLEVHNIFSITTTFATTTTINTRSISYWTANKKSGNTNSFSRFQTTRTKGTN